MRVSPLGTSPKASATQIDPNTTSVSDNTTSSAAGTCRQHEDAGPDYQHAIGRGQSHICDRHVQPGAARQRHRPADHDGDGGGDQDGRAHVGLPAAPDADREAAEAHRRGDRRQIAEEIGLGQTLADHDRDTGHHAAHGEPHRTGHPLREHAARECGQPKRAVQFAINEQPRVGGPRDPWNSSYRRRWNRGRSGPCSDSPASCITFLSEQAFAPQNTRFWSRRRVWFQFTVGEDKPPMLSVDNRGKGVLSMDCSAKRSPL